MEEFKRILFTGLPFKLIDLFLWMLKEKSKMNWRLTERLHRNILHLQQDLF